MNQAESELARALVGFSRLNEMGLNGLVRVSSHAELRRGQASLPDQLRLLIQARAAEIEAAELNRLRRRAS